MIIAEQKSLEELKTLIADFGESAGRRLRYLCNGVFRGRRA